MQHDKKSVKAAQAANVLIAALNSTENANALDRYHVVDIIKALQSDPNAEQEDFFKVEWAYLPLLDRDLGVSPKFLEQRLADDPEFFCEVIRTVFRSKNEEQPTEEPTEQKKNIALNAYHLINHWCIPPGSQKDGSFNGSVLTAWLGEVKKICEKSGHIEVALSMAGQVLVCAPPDPDGLWIHRSAAECMNSKDADKMRDGFRIRLFNSRGVHWVDPTGSPERELADKYRKQADEVATHGYHRLADTLRELSASYEREAEWIVQREK